MTSKLYAYPAGKTDTHYTIPENVTTIGWYAFRDCTNLDSISFNEQVQEIGGSAFYGCTALTTINLPESVTEIGGAAFENCYSLNSVRLSSNIKVIEYFTFRNCSNLQKIKIPLAVEKIGREAFRQCSKLTDIVFGNNVSVIESGAFYNCPISDVCYMGTEDEWNKITVENENDPLTKATIHCNYVCTNTSVTKEGDETIISVIPANAPTGVSILVGLYRNGQFADVAVAEYNGTEITVKTKSDFDKIKVMMWNDLKTMSPICSPEEL